MKRTSWLGVMLVTMLAVIIVGCGAPLTRSAARPGESVGLPNPAAVYCEEEGGDYEIRTDAEGNQGGVCRFDDGTECDNWAFYRGECTSGSEEAASPEGEPAAIGMANPPSVHCEAEGGTLDLRSDEDDNQYGMCVFADGTECEEWAFYRGECTLGTVATTSPDL